MPGTGTGPCRAVITIDLHRRMADRKTRFQQLLDRVNGLIGGQAFMQARVQGRHAPAAAQLPDVHVVDLAHAVDAFLDLTSQLIDIDTLGNAFKLRLSRRQALLRISSDTKMENNGSAHKASK